MKLVLSHDLLWVNAVSAALILTIAFVPSTALRILLGLPFLLLLPGYTWISALFPRSEQLDVTERLLFSFGLSLVVVPLVALLLSPTPFGITLNSLLVTLSVLILTGSLLSLYRRRRWSPDARSIASLQSAFARWRSGSPSVRLLSILLVITCLGTIGVVSNFIANPRTSETFTQFYILGAQNKTDNYPTELKLGQPAQVTVGVVNQEGVAASYQIEITIDGVKNGAFGPFVLQNGEKREQTVSITPTKAGDDQKVALFVYRDQGKDPYLQPLRLSVNVR